MSKFDSQRLVDRVWVKHYKKIHGKHQAKRLLEAKKLAIELNVIKGIETVIDWCNARRINVSFTSKTTGTYNGAERLICINSKQTLAKQLYVLLHECGHLLIDDRSKTTEFRFRKGYYVTDENIKKLFIYRCTVVEEEFEAWSRGRKLAKKLGIKINDDAFDDLKSALLKTYMKWAIGDPEHQENGPSSHLNKK